MQSTLALGLLGLFFIMIKFSKSFILLSFNGSLAMRMFFHLFTHFFLSGECSLSKLSESGLDTDVALCRSLSPGETTLFMAEALELNLRDLSVILRHVDFIAYNYKGEGFWHHNHAFLKERLLPVSEVLERLRVSDVVDK